mgnify:FL=1
MKFWVYPLIMLWFYLFISLLIGMKLMYSSNINFQELGAKQIQLQVLVDAENNNFNDDNNIDYSKEIEKLRYDISIEQEKYTKDLLESSTMQFIGKFMLFVYAVFFYLLFTFHIRRLHDLNKSGWLSLLILLPIINLYVFIICGFFKWTNWPNKYWPDPLKKDGNISDQSEDTVIEL